MLTSEEQNWLSLLRVNDEQGLESIFLRYYKYLVVTGYNILEDDSLAKDVVQDVFFEIWKKRNALDIKISLKAFLRRAVVNKCIDEIRKRKKVVFNDELLSTAVEGDVENVEFSGHQDSKIALVTKAIETLPEKCKLVFKLSRFEDMSHKEIAASLGISTKTIENHITKAMKTVRHFLAKHSTIGILAWIYFLIHLVK